MTGPGYNMSNDAEQCSSSHVAGLTPAVISICLACQQAWSDNTRRGASLTLHHDIREVRPEVLQRLGQLSVKTLPACKVLLIQF